MSRPTRKPKERVVCILGDPPKMLWYNEVRGLVMKSAAQYDITEEIPEATLRPGLYRIFLVVKYQKHALDFITRHPELAQDVAKILELTDLALSENAFLDPADR